MLEKNKDYIEFTLQCTSVERSRDKNYHEVCFNGYSDANFPCVPMDVVCKEFNHKVVMMSKSDFERLRADNQHYRDMAKQWEENYNILLKKTGFDTMESLIFYLTNIGKCDTLLGALASLRDRTKYTCDEWKDMKKKLEECEKDYISERDKTEALEKEIGIYSRTLNERKEGTGCPSPSAAKTLIEAYKHNHKEWQKTTGCLRPEDVSTESMISKSMANEITAANEELWSKNEKCEKENVDLYAEIRKWKDMTKCDTPEAAATWITSYESACGRGNRLAKNVEKLKEEVVSWKNVTGYSTPESYLSARINNTTPFDYTAACRIATEQLCCGRDLRHNLQVDLEYYRTLSSAQAKSIYCWKEATGCDTPEEAETTMRNLRGRIDEMKDFAAIASNWTDRIVED